jgi:hypothetical protein
MRSKAAPLQALGLRFRGTRTLLVTISRLDGLSEFVSVFLHKLLSLATSIITALVMCWSPNLHRLFLLDRVDQCFLPMKQLLGGTHLGG